MANPEQNDQFSFTKAEEKVLQFWKQENIFKKSLEKTKEGKRYIFYDGPPFATGLPHHGHLVASTIKDIVPRYFTMQEDTSKEGLAGTAMVFLLNKKLIKSLA